MSLYVNHKELQKKKSLPGKYWELLVALKAGPHSLKQSDLTPSCSPSLGQNVKQQIASVCGLTASSVWYLAPLCSLSPMLC